MALDTSSPLNDGAFDRVYDDEMRVLSPQHWTPVAVGERAACMLTDLGARRILDIGSGVGKFCIVGALTTRAEFHGVEQRERLVEIAQTAALHFKAARAHFVHANALAISFEDYDGFYLYNPFHEQISHHLMPIDRAVRASVATHRRYVAGTIEKLVALPEGTPVVSYHGFGGRMPSSYRFVGDEPAGSDSLKLWIKK